MTVHLKDGAPELERSVKFMRQTITNIVACIQRSAMCEEDLAWEIAIAGFHQALAERVAAGEDPKGKCAVIAGMFGQAVADAMAQEAEFERLERALAAGSQS